MAQKTDTYLVDDTTGETLYDEPGTTISFTIDGVDMEFDASDATAVKFSEAVAPYVSVARKVKRGKRKGAKSTPVGPSREESKRIRDAAKAAGVEVAERGRIPEAVKAQFSHA